MCRILISIISSSGGKASGPCAETGRGTVIFTHEYPKATVEWNGHIGRGEVTMK